MNIIIIAHERSLNKAEGLLRAYRIHNVTLITEHQPDVELKPYVKYATRLFINKGFELVNIINEIPKCDKVWCVSENLLPLQSQLESYYGIDNLSPFAAEVLSNKQKFDDYCRTIGLEEYIPNSISPTFHKQLDTFKNKEIFTKPDIGTGSNPSFYGKEVNVEYRRWNNKHHFLQFLKDQGIHNDFFKFNQVGIHTKRFNYKPCKIMMQEYFWSEEPSISPYGHVKDGKIDNLFYVKNSKVNYGNLLDSKKNPIELHSNSRTSDLGRDICVWAVSNSEVEKEKHDKIQYFMQTVVQNLGIKDLMFAGPDFHINNDNLYAIDFNARPGQFINILDKANDYKIFESIVSGKDYEITNRVLWGCSMLKDGVIKQLDSLDTVQKHLNAQNTKLEVGLNVPKFQNLQSKSFSMNLDIIGKNEQELFNKYKQVNQLLQNCITY